MNPLPIILLALLLDGCGGPNDTVPVVQPAPSPYYSMTWSCGSNSACAQRQGAYSGAGQFTNESDCLAWETAFINSYSGSTVTACTYHQ
jgi:hypothetical protein